MSGTTWVTLLRAVNLGPTNKLAMADLRALLESLGYQDVRTHLQSGNAVFTAPSRSATTIEKAVDDALRAKGMGPSVRTMARTAADLAKVVAGSPFGDTDAKQVHVVFLAGRPKQADLAKYAPSELVPGDRCVYVKLPSGVQGARLPDWERVLGVAGTMRTWRTVTRLHELASG